MRKAVFFFTTLVFLTTVLSSGSQGDERSMAPSKIPSAIQEFYEVYNYITAFSTQEERQLLSSSELRCADREVIVFLKRKDGSAYEFDCQSGEVNLKDKAKLSRIDKIRLSLLELDQRVLWIDPRMSVYVSSHVVSGGLVKISRTRCGKDSVVIEALHYPLDSEINKKLIVEYDAGKRESVPPLHEVLEMSNLERIPWKEIHKWVLLDGKWMKNEANLVLLDLEKKDMSLANCD